jgi:hypothetical protein
LRQTQRQGFLEDHLVHALTQAHAQQGLAEADAALAGCEHGHQYAFDADEPQSGRIGDRAAGLVISDQLNDRVDDELADIGDAGGQDAGQNGQRAEAYRQAAVRRPDEDDGPSAVIEQIEEIPPSGRLARARICIACWMDNTVPQFGEYSADMLLDSDQPNESA